MIKNIKDKKDIILFLGARDKNEFPQINIEGINIIYSITNKDTLWNGERGRINRVMIEYLENEKEKEDISFYICGAPHMVMDTKKLLEACNINKDKIYYEKFGF